MGSQFKRIIDLINQETKRQNNELSLIASENYAPKYILEAQGSTLTNKYVEGYFHNRYYGGCRIIDQIEQIAIILAKKLFDADHANVQPHSGSQANAAAYFALLKPKDKVLAMSLDSGGHLTHGHEKNFSGNLYNFHFYSVNKKTEMIDYDDLEIQALKIKPKLIIAGASSYSRIINFKRIGEIAKKVNAYFLVDMAHIAGLVATKLHPSPIPFADVVTSTTHKTLRGARGGLILCKSEFKELIDSAVFPGIQGGAIMGAIAGKALVFANAFSQNYIEYQKKVIKCSKVFAKSFKKIRIISNGTENHQFTLDVYNSLHINGNDACELLEKAKVIVNKNVIPYDILPPNKSSGIRLGTPACVTRGLVERDFERLAYHIENLLIKKSNNAIDQLKKYVIELCKKYPLPY